jgi:hypothetical protein
MVGVVDDNEVRRSSVMDQLVVVVVGRNIYTHIFGFNN